MRAARHAATLLDPLDGGLRPCLRKCSPAPPLPQVLQIACGGMHTVALLDDGRIFSWGVNDEGALGRETGVPAHAACALQGSHTPHLAEAKCMKCCPGSATCTMSHALLRAFPCSFCDWISHGHAICCNLLQRGSCGRSRVKRAASRATPTLPERWPCPRRPARRCSYPWVSPASQGGEGNSRRAAGKRGASKQVAAAVAAACHRGVPVNLPALLPPRAALAPVQATATRARSQSWAPCGRGARIATPAASWALARTPASRHAARLHAAARFACFLRFVCCCAVRSSCRPGARTQFNSRRRSSCPPRGSPLNSCSLLPRAFTNPRKQRSRFFASRRVRQGAALIKARLLTRCRHVTLFGQHAAL